ncbi:GxxExxY protein [Pedobacter punctiformis]|uniref:GxxExxY protein n=1 Tax=Pedobacter punctiformis TaxID=3004097 RepID=A0ABT4L9R4_9SPHI|nr:GxxExxY protein [Pedobacter sp. HCMS5-2]MCZ4244663.1 GxxExxY protein [Pedobacter sp. HCMS5-2]
MTEDEIAKLIVQAAHNVHVELGPGSLESAYKACLIYELKNLGLKVSSQVMLPVVYREVNLDCGYRIDILVEEKVIIEMKVVSELNNVDFTQALTYLKLSNCKLGLLINFNVSRIKDGIRCIVNGYL